MRRWGIDPRLVSRGFLSRVGRAVRLITPPPTGKPGNEEKCSAEASGEGEVHQGLMICPTCNYRGYRCVTAIGAQPFQVVRPSR
jgi:hypothetical protein